MPNNQSSSAKDRLFLIYEAYSAAYDRRDQDWKEAKSKAQAKAIFRNVERLELLYLKAAKQALDANGPAVEAAYEAAKGAQKAIDDAYNDAKELSEKIRLVSSVIKKVSGLVTKASGK